MRSRPSLLAELARAHLQEARIVSAAKGQPPLTEEERRAVAEGTLKVFDIVGGPRIVIDLRAGRAGG